MLLYLRLFHWTMETGSKRTFTSPPLDPSGLAPRTTASTGSQLDPPHFWTNFWGLQGL